MTRQATLGELEHLTTLLAVLRLGDEAWGAKIRRELEETAQRAIAIATVYVTLVRLEKKGFLTSWQADPEPVRGGKAKKCYALTSARSEALREARATLVRMWAGIDVEDPAGR